jgi:hypothetical protein
MLEHIYFNQEWKYTYRRNKFVDVCHEKKRSSLGEAISVSLMGELVSGVMFDFTRDMSLTGCLRRGQLGW